MSREQANQLVKDGISAAKAGDRDQCRRLLEEAVALDRQNEMAWLWLGGVQDPKDGIACLHKVLEINPANDRAKQGLRSSHLKVALAALDQDKKDEAILHFNEVLKLDPKHDSAWTNLVRLAGSPIEELRILERLAEVAPDHELVQGLDEKRFDIGMAIESNGDSVQARELFEEVLKYDPQNDKALFRMALLADNPRDAVAHLEKVLQANPDHPVAFDLMQDKRFQAGVAEATAGNLPQARAYFQQVLDQDATHEQAMVRLARLAENEREASKIWRRVLKLNPTNEEAQEALLQIDSGGGPTPWHCPLCGHAQAQPVEQCPTCGAYLVLENGEALVHNAKLNVPQMERAIEHYSKLLMLSEDALTHQYLMLAHANLRQFDQAMEHAEAAMRLKPLEQNARNHVNKLNQIVRIVHASLEQTRRASAKHVLVVDDSPTVRQLAQTTLEKQGFRVTTAGDGAEAVNSIKTEGAPDLILLDLTIPGTNGYELCKYFRQFPATQKAPIVLLSGRDSIVDKIRGRLAGSSGFMTKPFQADSLVELAQKHCKVSA